jgi:hypothetical protein
MSGSTNIFNNKTAGQENSLPKWQYDLINQILNAMKDFYCLPDKFDNNKEILKNQLVNKCKALNKSLFKNDPGLQPPPEEQYKKFLGQINKVLHGFDTHLELEYNPKFIAEMQTRKKIKNGTDSAKFDFSGGPPKEEIEKWNAYEQDNPGTRNFGFVDYQGADGVIPANIGYVNISHLIDPQLGATESEEKYKIGPHAIKRLHEVMAALQEKEGIVLDLSVTPFGGSPEMVQNIVSFFIPKGTLINTVHNRITGHPTTYESIDTPFKLLDKPVVLLVGPHTFSGREEITYDLQQYNTTLAQDRFTVIGTRTKGGAHPECSFPLMEASTGKINQNLVLRVPYATTINPVSKTNWEDGPQQKGEKPGIQPDIEPPRGRNVLAFGLTHLQSMIDLGKDQDHDITARQMARSDFGKGSDTARRSRIWGSASEQQQAAQTTRSEVKKASPSITQHQSPTPFSADQVMKPKGFK